MTGGAAGRRLLLLGLPLLLAGCGEPPAPAWHDAGDHRWRELQVEGEGAGFTLLAPSETGIRFTNSVPEEDRFRNRILAAGSGVALGDVDGDGRTDVYLARAVGRNALYRNLGDWKFREVTDEAGVALADAASKGVALADVDGDGDPDLLVAVLGGRNRLFENDGTGRFRDVTASSGLTGEAGSTTMALADVEGDGDLDLYVTNYKTRRATDIFPPRERALDRVVQERAGGYVVAPRFREHYRIEVEGDLVRRWEVGEADALYLNDGSGRFERASFTGGRFLDERGRPLEETPRDWGLAARFHDLDGDGDQDLYVCNDFESPDRIWMNRGDGTFRAVDSLAVRTTSASSMAVDFADLDRDGDLDFFVADMLARGLVGRKRQVAQTRPGAGEGGALGPRPQQDRNTLQLNRGDHTWAEVARYAGVEATGWTWATLFLDVDLDGYEDLLATTGHAWDQLNADIQERLGSPGMRSDWRRELGLYPPLPLRNVALRNRGDITFQDRTRGWGFGPEKDVSHGIAAGDLDGDGDRDLVVTRLEKPVAVYRNDVGAPRVAVRLVRGPGNSEGVGATVRVEGGAVPVQTAQAVAGGMYLSDSDGLYSFAAGEADSLRVEVRWPDGRRTMIPAARPNRLYEVRHPGPRGGGSVRSARERGASEAPAPYFEDVSARLGHLHTDRPYDDFVLQPLLPLKLSRLGPGVSWADVDADGDPDLLVGAGRGGHVALFRNDGGRFVRRALGDGSVESDVGTLLALPTRAGGARIVAARMNYEGRSPREALGLPAVEDLDDGESVLSGVRGGAGPLTAADVDADGDLDLFAGGRVVPGRYPEAPGSTLLRNEGGRLVPDSAASAAFDEVGMVSGAVFSDLEGDGDPDLVLAVEWGPVRIYENRGGRLRDATSAWGLEGYTGRWNGVATGDLNEDGRPDLIVTGWGENTRFRPSEGGPLLLYHGDLDANGTVDLVEARRGREVDAVVPLRGLQALREAVPYVGRRLGSFEAYSTASVSEVFGPRIHDAGRVEASRLAHTVFLSRRESAFETRRLPAEAQFAPAFGVTVADFDGDGHEDVFLAQNFSPMRPGTAPYRAGRGLWLRGDGRGGLAPVPGQVTGVRLYGDGRGTAVADFDGDGRVDLVATQNGGRTRLYHNQGADPGLRVRLAGPPENPGAVGAAVRVVYPDGRGPLREVQSGTGYWSDDGDVQVLGLVGRAVAVEVRWPDGGVTRTRLEPDAREVTLRWPDAGEGPGGRTP